MKASQFTRKTCKQIFTKANEDLSAKNAFKNKSEDDEGEGGDDENAEFQVEVDRTIEQIEFACALCRLAQNRYMTVLARDHPKCKATYPAMKLYMEEVIVPWFDHVKALDDEEKANKHDLMVELCAPALKKFAPKVKALYTKISASGENRDAMDTLDCSEFLSFCKKCGITGGSFSMADALEVYMYCNSEEMEGYFTNAKPMEDINVDLQVWSAECHARSDFYVRLHAR